MHNVALIISDRGRQAAGPAATTSVAQLRNEEWQGTRAVVGSDGMPSSTEMRAGDAQYDDPLRDTSCPRKRREQPAARTRLQDHPCRLVARASRARRVPRQAARAFLFVPRRACAEGGP